MTYEIDDRVVLNPHGVGRIAGLVTKSFAATEVQEYYEIATERSLVWVAVGQAEAHGLRPVTGKIELNHFREVLRARPTVLNTDHRQRHLELHSRERLGTFQAACELVRDLTAYTWKKPLNDVDTATLRHAHTDVCAEWAAADEVTLAVANAEVAALLLEGRAAWAPKPDSSASTTGRASKTLGAPLA
jgi:RNA polymerase-interacting CarD/CdnL/TRCF family regulator